MSENSIVKSIFDRASKKVIPALFTHKVARPPEVAKAGEKPSGFKRLFPFGIDIGTDSIKIVQFGLTEDGSAKIAKTFKAKLSKNLSEQLKHFLGTSGLWGDCYTAIPETYVKVKLVKLPKMPPAEIKEALRWQIKAITRQDIKEVSWDYLLLENQASTFLSNQVGVLVVSVSKKDVFEYLAFLQSAGLNPLALDISPLANLAASEYTGKVGPGETVLFLDFGAGKTVLSIICNRELISTRSISVTGNSLTKAVSDYCGISQEEADALKREAGIVATVPAADRNGTNLARSFEGKEGQGSGGKTPSKALQAKNAILPLLETLAQSIEHTFKYFSYQITQSQIRRIDKVLLSGGCSHLKGLTSFLKDRLNTEVSLVDEPLFSTALGLALRGTEG